MSVPPDPAIACPPMHMLSSTSASFVSQHLVDPMPRPELPAQPHRLLHLVDMRALSQMLAVPCSQCAHPCAVNRAAPIPIYTYFYYSM
jgi:hypothetical protein